jgi:hypothetical protein
MVNKTKQKNKMVEFTSISLMEATKEKLMYLKLDLKLKTYDACIQYLLQQEKSND